MTLPKYLSPSQLRLFEACPLAYKRRYVEGIVDRVPMVFSRGKGLDTAARIQLTKRALCRADLSDQQFRRAALAAHDLAVIEDAPDQDLSPFESSERVDAAAGQWWQRFVASPDALMPRHQSDIQKKVQRTPPGAPYSILGYLDVVLVEGVVCDVKYQDKAPRGDAISHARDQLVTYAWMCALDKAAVAIGWPGGAEWQAMTVRQADVEETLGAYRQMWEALVAGQFQANPSGWMCRERYCGAFLTCRERDTVPADPLDVDTLPF